MASQRFSSAQGAGSYKVFFNTSTEHLALLSLPQRPSIFFTHQFFTLNSANNKQWDMTQYIGGGNNSFNITNSFYNEGKDHRVADDRSQLLTWLSPLEPRLQHRDIQERRVDDVGKWVFETKEFKGWCRFGEECEGSKPVLFFY